MRNVIIPKWAPWVLAIVATIGLADALYLTVKHFNGETPNCTILSGCEPVLSSVYSEILGVPVALLGSLFYLIVIILSVAVIDRKNPLLFCLVCLITPLGFLASIWFVFLQLFIIKALCLYCLGSALSSTILFTVGMISLQTNTNKP